MNKLINRLGNTNLRKVPNIKTFAEEKYKKKTISQCFLFKFPLIFLLQNSKKVKIK